MKQTYTLTLTRWHKVAERLARDFGESASECRSTLTQTVISAYLGEEQEQFLQAQTQKALGNLERAFRIQDAVAIADKHGLPRPETANTTWLAPDALMASAHGRDAERATPGIRRLAGCRLAVSSESKEGQKLDVAMVKRQTGDEFMTARGMYENTFTFEITHKVMLLTNHKPALDHVDAATKARLHLVPFDRRWNRPGDTEHDPQLPDGDKTLMAQLKSEAPGILAWLVRGALAYERDGLEPPEEVKSMTRTYFAEQDPFGLWLPTREICDASQGTLAADLFEQFRTWCVAEEFSANDAGTQKAFAAKLANKNVFSQKLNNGRRYGIKPMQSESATFCDLDQAEGDNADSEESLV